MKTRRYRGWRFVHPDYDVGRGMPGLRISPRGGIDMVEGDESLRQAVLLLISTKPGERVMRPAYGCDLHQLVFAPNDLTTAGLAIHYVRRAIELYEPRIEVLSLSAGPNPDRSELLDISLHYRVRATQRTENVALSLNLFEGEV